jgi:hypothetical protein
MIKFLDIICTKEDYIGGRIECEESYEGIVKDIYMHDSIFFILREDDRFTFYSNIEYGHLYIHKNKFDLYMMYLGSVTVYRNK